MQPMHIPLSVQATQAAEIKARSFAPNLVDGGLAAAIPAAGSIAIPAVPAVPALEVIPCSPACRLTGSELPPGTTLLPFDGDSLAIGS